MKRILLTTLLLTLSANTIADSPYNDSPFKEGGPVERIATPEVDIALGIEYTDKGKIKDAIIVYSRLIKSHPLQPEPFLNLAMIYAKSKNYGKGLNLVNTYLKKYPNYAPALKTKKIIKQMSQKGKSKSLKT